MSSPMEDLVVPQREVGVVVHLQDGRDLAGTMFVPAIGPDGEPGQLIDRLNQESEEFLALREKDTPRTFLIHETRILSVNVEDDEVEERVEQRIEESESSRHLLVKIQLSSGTEIIGNLAYLQSVEHERLQDFLNKRRRFFPIRIQNQLVYVNRDQIISVLALRGE